jgi:hypothetical protein
VRPDLSILLAAIAIASAVVAMGLMVASVVAARAVRERLGPATLRASGSAGSVRRSLRDARQSLARSAETSDRLRVASEDLDVRVEAWTEELTRVRGSVARASHDRIERIVRVLSGIASIARLMVLWKP